MRIALINPSVRIGARYFRDPDHGDFVDYLGEFHPLGLLSIASSLRKRGYTDIRVVDAQAGRLTAARAAGEAARLRPDVIGISCLTFSYLYVLDLARALRRVSPAVIVVGGPHVGLYPREVLASRGLCHSYYQLPRAPRQAPP